MTATQDLNAEGDVGGQGQSTGELGQETGPEKRGEETKRAADEPAAKEERLSVPQSPPPPPTPPTPPPEPHFPAPSGLGGRGSQQSDSQQPTRSSLQQNQTLQVPPTRKSSSISFKDVAELFEIDLEASKRPPKPPLDSSLRFYVMALALVSPFVVTYSKTIINFAIIDMIDPSYLSQGQAGSLSPAEQEVCRMPRANGTAAGSSEKCEPLFYFDRDNSCPVDEETRSRLITELANDESRARNSEGEKFEWDDVRQGLLKAAYSIGHILLQVMGGRLSEIYGSSRIMVLSSAFIGLSCLLAPFLASAHFYLLFADLFLLGILGSFMTPALITLFSNWLTPSEKSIMFSFYLVSSRLGYALSSLLCGTLIEAQVSWRYLFYSAGWISLLFSLSFAVCARSQPHRHPLIEQRELDYLASKNMLVREALARSAAQGRGKMGSVKLNEMEKVDTSAANNASTATGSKESPSTTPAKAPLKAKGAPWMAILTNVPVWAFITTKFCVKLAGDTVQIELPAYLKRVMHLEPRRNGYVNAWNYIIFCVSCILVGMLAKIANKRHPFGMSRTAVRKLFQVTASLGASLSLLGIALSVCHETSTLTCLMLMFFFTTFGTGGEAQIPMDISERYAGTIHALGSSLAISGAIEPILVGYILKGHSADRDRWAGVWMGASGIAFLGGLVFLLFGDATIQPFDKLDNQEASTGSQGPVTEQKSVGGLGGPRASSLKKGRENEAFELGELNKTVLDQPQEAAEEAHSGQDDMPAYRESVEL